MNDQYYHKPMFKLRIHKTQSSPRGRKHGYGFFLFPDLLQTLICISKEILIPRSNNKLILQDAQVFSSSEQPNNI